MTIIMGDNIDSNEAELVVAWLNQHHPNVPKHIKIEKNEYIVVVVSNDTGEPIAYSVTKPTVINIQQC